MPRQTRVLPALALALSLLLTGACSGDPEGEPAAALVTSMEAAAAPGVDRPNVVLITSDDQTAMEMEWLPKTRRAIGRAGVTFEDMVAPHPNCCPARAQILTGQYAQNNGVARNSPPRGGFEGLTSETALPVWLEQAGYRTGFVGKYLHGYDGSTGVEPGWDHFKPVITQPLSSYYDLVQLVDGEPQQLPDDVYHTRLVSDQSRELITDLAGGDEPFFLWSSYIAPHGSCETTEENDCSGPPIPEPRYADAFRDAELPVAKSPSFNEEDVSDKPGRIGKSDKVSLREQRRLFRARLRALASLDDAVAATIRELDRAGVLDETVVAFTSDNGYLFGEHRQTGKVLAYEESLRVPLLVRGPGVPAGESRSQTVAMVDLAPTIAALAGAEPMVPVDGVSWWGYATDDSEQGDRALLVQAGSRKEEPKTPQDAWTYRAVRTDRYTFVRWTKRRPELYDRQVDPFQLDNVAQDPSYREQRAALGRVLDRLGRCSGQDCRVEVAERAGLG